MGFFERLFCSHDYICIRNFVAGDGYLSSAWRCKHCSKEISKRGQHELHDSVRNIRYSDSRSTDDFMNPLNPISPNYIGNYSIPSSSEHKAKDCEPSHSSHNPDYGSSSYSSSDSCSSSSDSSSSSSSSFD